MPRQFQCEFGLPSDPRGIGQLSIEVGEFNGDIQHLALARGVQVEIFIVFTINF
jgi:hypothetical protein